MQKTFSAVRTFIFSVLLLTWGVMGGLLFGLRPEPLSIEFIAILSASMLLPGLVAGGVLLAKEGETIRDLVPSISLSPWLLVAWIIPVLVCALAVLIGVSTTEATFTTDLSGLVKSLRGEVSPERMESLRAENEALQDSWLGRPSVFLAVSFVQVLGAGATLNLVFALGEEIGWRGFLHRRLEGLGFWTASGVVGVVWGVWHAPAVYYGYNFPDHPYLGIVMMTLLTLLMSPVLAHLHAQARTVLAPGLFHGTFNAAAGQLSIMIEGGSNLVAAPMGAAGIVVLLLLNAGVWAHRNGRISFLTASSSAMHDALYSLFLAGLAATVLLGSCGLVGSDEKPKTQADSTFFRTTLNGEEIWSGKPDAAFSKQGRFDWLALFTDSMYYPGLYRESLSFHTPFQGTGEYSTVEIKRKLEEGRFRTSGASFHVSDGDALVSTYFPTEWTNPVSRPAAGPTPFALPMESSA
ncbi:CPBP family glutamic-type intramembrane protease [Salinibacter altiplanensis]|uniref:CPBP family glutamic-type intramembrane protease n=1 Tax=Salinibacter altiplanensis TaxID=1803181 RepID=UPI000C9FD4B1|nr:CPBP family glutamic-type intramembrane protease [Salinibacter altiplanensis]